MDLFEFFDGKVQAWGIVQNRSGKAIQRFTVDIDGSIANDALTLKETFHYQFGSGPEYREWILKVDGSRVTGTADDIVNPATGLLMGNALNFRYKMDLSTTSGTYRVNFDDWMWLMDTETLINRATIKKFGITFAEVTIFMQRHP